MDIIASVILIPFIVGIITNRVDAVLFAPIIEELLKRFQQDEKQLSHELKKALKICLLSALQSIVLECHKELLGFSPIRRYRGVIVYPLEHQKELQWLDIKLRQLAKDLKHVKQQKNLDIYLPSFDEITFLLTPEGQLAEEYMFSLKEKLIAEALLKDNFVPEIYETKIRKALFEKLQEIFVYEVQFNPKICEIFHTHLLSQINTKLTDQNLKIKQLEQALHEIKISQVKQPPEARRKVKLEFDIENLDSEILEKIIEEIRNKTGDKSIIIRRIEEGSMDLIFDGSQKGIEKLEALIKSGEIKDLFGIKVKCIESEDADVLLSQTFVNLAQWLQNIIDASWQTVREVLGEETGKLVVARNAVSSEGILRAQRIDLLTEAQTIPLVLIVGVQAKPSEEKDIRLELYPIDSKFLPLGLKYFVLDSSGKILKEDQAKTTDNLIQLKINGKTGENFSLIIELGNDYHSWNFVI
ncbi:DUF1822 family protein [Fischerella thermalis]|uniref:DUF1822 family protein n=1 Tax=Fischerella thermalis TaxID=372787 RepID=UPI001A03DF16|nr:DUF1822 family protein [Fischerella thermalis]MBF2060782.1 DUF1822 family protein [Fischerella thermalis M66_A2018_004]